MTTDPHQPPAGASGGPGTPVPDDPSAGRTPPSAPGLAFFNRIRTLGIVRPDDGRIAAGVCAGIARRYGLDPLLVRGVFVVLAVIGGFGAGLYGLAWLFLPHPDGRIHAEGVLHGAVTAGFVGALLLVVLDLGRGGGHAWHPGGWWFGWGVPGFGWGVPEALVPLLVIAFLWWLIATYGRGNAPRGPRPGPYPGGAYPGPGPGGAYPSTGDTTPQGPGGPAAGGPGPAATPLAPPPRLNLHAPSHALTLSVLGLALVGAAVTVLWDRLVHPLPAHTALVAPAVALGIVALGVVLAGLLGRRSGGLAPVAIILALACVGAAAGHAGASPLGHQTWRPASAAETGPGYDLGIGDGILDLTDPQLVAGRPAGDPVNIRVDVGVGRLQVVVPSGTAVEVVASVGAGNITDGVNHVRTSASGSAGGAGVDRVISSGGGSPVVVVHANVGLGSVEVEPQGQPQVVTR